MKHVLAAAVAATGLLVAVSASAELLDATLSIDGPVAGLCLGGRGNLGSGFKPYANFI